MSKSTHFIVQPLYSQVIKLLDKSKILQISQEKGGEHYTKSFTMVFPKSATTSHSFSFKTVQKE